jgi:hypothetical protein
MSKTFTRTYIYVSSKHDLNHGVELFGNYNFYMTKIPTHLPWHAYGSTTYYFH